MDTVVEYTKMKWVLGAGLMVLVSGFFSFVEFRYAISGKKTEAQLVDAKQVVTRGRWGRKRSFLHVVYRFNDGDMGERTGMDDVSSNWPIGNTPVVAVQYIPGATGWSRLSGNRRDWAVIVFGLSLCGVGWAGYMLYRTVNTPIRATTDRNRRVKYYER